MTIAPAWLQVAKKEMGVLEIPGEEHNERILLYHDYTTLDASTDEVPWCSSFVNFCIAKCDLSLPYTRSARARSWLLWGQQQSIPAYGCIVVMKRGGQGQPGPDVLKAPGHVGFFIEPVGKSRIRILGGNQKNSVCERDYSAGRVLSYRWPE